eukprot:COSAG06_NODE_3550_length_5199_cov_2.627451_3_plen_81_part_00
MTFRNTRWICRDTSRRTSGRSNGLIAPRVNVLIGVYRHPEAPAQKHPALAAVRRAAEHVPPVLPDTGQSDGSKQNAVDPS